MIVKAGGHALVSPLFCSFLTIRIAVDHPYIP